MGLIFASLITAPHFSISECRNEARASGVEPVTTAPPSSSSFVLIAGIRQRRNRVCMNLPGDLDGWLCRKKDSKPLRARCCEHAQCALPSERQARRGEYAPGRSETVACLTAINPSLSLTLSWNEF